MGATVALPWWRRPGTWLAAACLVVVLMALVFRQPLADRLWPQARAQALREQADAALAAGQLTAADGSGARELYEAALAIDPDRTEARAGLMAVARAALADARRAVAAGQFGRAHAALGLARELSIPRDAADAVAAELRHRESGVAGIDGLLRQAERARREGRIDGGADAALPIYRRILEFEPGRIEALEAREDLISELLQQAGQSLQRGQLAAAAAALSAARGHDIGHGELPAFQANLARAIERARQRADDDLRRGRLDAAAAGYRELLDVDGQDASAVAGLERVGAAHAARAERAASDFRFDEAEAALRQARAHAPDAPAIAQAARHVERARRSQARLQPTLPVAQRARGVSRLLEEAAAAEARGDLLTPPGDSAFDKLRAARAIAPDSAAVQRASARLLPAATACFEEQLRGNNLARARSCLDASEVLGAREPRLADARRRLALRWLAVGDERLGAGEVAGAAAALESARQLDGAAPGLDEFSERVRLATAGNP